MKITIIDDIQEPSHPSPAAVGDVVAVDGLICARNDMGGTVILAERRMDCRVAKAFWDYEVGWRYHAMPVAQPDAESVRRQGRTGHACIRGAEPLDGKVFFCEHDLAKGRP